MDSGDTFSDFSLLPPHIIAQIFKLLKFRQRLNAARTCKSWYFASCDPMIWKNTRVKISHKLQRLDELRRPFGTLVLQRIDFNQFVYYPEFFARFGQYIRELKFDNCNISLQQLIDCLILTPCLVSLAIVVNNKMFASDLNLSDEQMGSIKTNLSCIKSFKIALDTPNGDGLHYFMQMLSNVKFLNYTISDYGEGYVYKHFFDYINMFRGGINLTRLSIGSLTGKCSEEFFTDFSKITQNLNVDELVMESVNGDRYDIEYNIKFDDFCKKLSGVRILTMRTIYQNQLYHVCRYMSQLTEICFSRIQQNIKMQCIGSLRSLQKLTLYTSYNNIGNEDALLNVFTKLHQLKEIRLDYEISERVLNEMCTTCTNLTKLELLRIKTNKLSVLFKNLLKLKVLHLSLCLWRQEFTGSVDCDITNLKLLEELKINCFMPGLTIEHIEKLPNLRPESLLNIRNKLQTGYVDPILEDAYEIVSGLFD